MKINDIAQNNFLTFAPKVKDIQLEEQKESDNQIVGNIKQSQLLHEDSINQLSKDTSIIVGSYWDPNLTLSKSDISRMQETIDQQVNQFSNQEKLPYILADLQKKVKATDEAFKIYDKSFKEINPQNTSLFAKYEHGERKISSKEDYTSTGLLKKQLNEYQLCKLATSYSFSTLTKLCIEHGIGKDQIMDFKTSLEGAFSKDAPEYATYQDCYLNSTWSSLNIASSYRLGQLFELMGRLLDTQVGEAETQILRIKHALPFNLLMSQQLSEDDFEDTFIESQNKQELSKIFIKAMDDAYRISPEKYAIFASKNAFFEDLLVKYGLDLESNPPFKDIVTFLSSNKILSSFEDQKQGASMALKAVFQSTKNFLADTEYFNQDIFFRIGTSSDEAFAQHLSFQQGKTAQALCLWSKFFAQDTHNQTMIVKSNHEKETNLYSSQQPLQKSGFSPLKNVQIDTKTNIMTYEEDDGDDWCFIEKVSLHLQKKEPKEQNTIAQSMSEDYKQMVRILAEQSKATNAKVLEKQHDSMLNNTKFNSFNSQFNKTFMLEIQEPSISLGMNKSNDNSQDQSKWLGEMLSQLQHPDQIQGDELKIDVLGQDILSELNEDQINKEQI